LPLLVTIRSDGNQIGIIFEARAGNGYTVYRSEDLATAQWSILTTVPPGDSTRIETIRDEPPTQNQQRYYMISTP
jgi:hypothetical protein